MFSTVFLRLFLDIGRRMLTNLVCQTERSNCPLLYEPIRVFIVSNDISNNHGTKYSDKGNVFLILAGIEVTKLYAGVCFLTALQLWPRYWWFVKMYHCWLYKHNFSINIHNRNLVCVKQYPLTADLFCSTFSLLGIFTLRIFAIYRRNWYIFGVLAVIALERISIVLVWESTASLLKIHSSAHE